MSTITSNNRRIVKNTILLYFRMIFSTIVSLFTARLTLQLLGIENYGINNVVCSVIGFLSVITGTMISATQRFFSFDLGKKDILSYRKTFSMMINVYFIYSFIIIIIMELLGPYVINNYLVIPSERLIAAQWIYQFSIVTFAISTIMIPYQSSIVAYEKMGVYAYFTILDVIFKLLVVYALYITPIDRLITYGLLGLLMTIIINIIIFIYCRNKFDGCKFERVWDPSLFKKLSGYAGWNLFGSLSWVLNTQGQAVLLNIFFGPVVNAAKAIADRINSIINSFVTNFYMAVNPQIIKKYAEGDIDYMRALVCRSSKFGFLLLSVLSFPLLGNMQEVLTLWLGSKQVTNDMVIFSQLVLIYSMINTLEGPITQTIRATGNIKKYQILVGVQTLLFLPLSLVALLLGAPSYSTMIILCIVYAVVQGTRVYVASPILNIKYKEYIKKVILPIIYSVILGTVLIFISNLVQTDKLYTVIIKILMYFIIYTAFISIIAFTKNERSKILNFILKK